MLNGVIMPELRLSSASALPASFQLYPYPMALFKCVRNRFMCSYFTCLIPQNRAVPSHSPQQHQEQLRHLLHSISAPLLTLPETCKFLSYPSECWPHKFCTVIKWVQGSYHLTNWSHRTIKFSIVFCLSNFIQSYHFYRLSIYSSSAFLFRTLSNSWI